NGVTYQRVCFAARPVRHHPERALDDGIIGPRWLTRDELAAQPQRWRSHLVLRCIDDYLAGGRYPLALIRDTHVSPSLPQA
ncbi:TPA: NUDIX hydrolase, partial [Pseudomonas aeruginosa]